MNLIQQLKHRWRYKLNFEIFKNRFIEINKIMHDNKSKTYININNLVFKQNLPYQVVLYDDRYISKNLPKHMILYDYRCISKNFIIYEPIQITNENLYYVSNDNNSEFYKLCKQYDNLSEENVFQLNTLYDDNYILGIRLCNYLINIGYENMLWINYECLNDYNYKNILESLNEKEA